MRPPRRTLGVLLSTAVVATVAVGTVAGPAEASSPTAKVAATTQRMSGPTLKSHQYGTYAKGRTLTLSCYTHGQPVTGAFSGYEPYRSNHGYDDLWYKVSDGRYVADIDIDTRSTKAVGPKCSTGSTSPSLGSKVAKFVSGTRGKSVVNVQGTLRGQCVSLVSQYLKQVWGITTGYWGNAIDFRSGGTGGKQLKARGFSWSTSRSFKDGDILVWGPSASSGTGSYGHIGIWSKGQVYDQNDARHSPAATANYSGYFNGGLLGRWRR